MNQILIPNNILYEKPTILLKKEEITLVKYSPYFSKFKSEAQQHVYLSLTFSLIKYCLKEIINNEPVTDFFFV